jgi:hypothetical protein
MPAQAGIHDFSIRLHPVEEKSWMPACAGMTVERSERQTKRQLVLLRNGGG